MYVLSMKHHLWGYSGFSYERRDDAELGDQAHSSSLEYESHDVGALITPYKGAATPVYVSLVQYQLTALNPHSTDALLS